MSDYAIEINNLNKSYKSKNSSHQALKNINLKIKKGSFFGLLGPNGAGKSTLINILASIVKKDTGEIKIHQIDFDKNLNQAKQKLGIVPQELVQDPFFTVKETLDIYAGYYSVKKKDLRTNELIKVLGLEDKASVKPRSLSGGMKRRLLVAKALVHDPDIIILDEPTAGVDVELRDQLWAYIKKLNKAGKTIILTTHYLEEAEELCDQIAIIDQGEIITNEKKSKLKALFGHKKLMITLDKTNQNLAKKLEEFAEVELDGKTITLKYKNENFDYQKLLKNIQNENVKITDITTCETDIEDIFKNLIYKK